MNDTNYDISTPLIAISPGPKYSHQDTVLKYS